MPDADLCIDEIDYEGYLEAEDCVRCGAETCTALVERLRSGGAYEELVALRDCRGGNDGRQTKHTKISFETIERCHTITPRKR